MKKMKGSGDHIYPKCKVCDVGELHPAKVYRHGNGTVLAGHLMLLPLLFCILFLLVGMMGGTSDPEAQSWEPVRAAALDALGVAGLDKEDAKGFLDDPAFELPLMWHTPEYEELLKEMRGVRAVYAVGIESAENPPPDVSGAIAVGIGSVGLVPALICAAIGAVLVGKRRMLVCSRCRAATPAA